MAKPGVTFTLLCLLFFFFSFSYARFAADLPQNDVVTEKATEILPESDPKISASGEIRLPSEKTNSDPEKTTLEVKLDENDAVPLTFVSFHPVNRHFPRRPFPLALRHGRRCHRHFMMKPWGPQRRSYGDDMILSTGDRQGSDPVFRGGGGGEGVVRQIPARWIKIRQVEPRFPLRHGDEIEWRHHKHHHHHHDHHDHKHENENVFMKSFRKFMNHF